MAVEPIKAFLDEAISPESVYDDRTEKQTLHDAYYKFCNKHQLPLLKYDTFCKHIKNLKFLDARAGKDEREYYWKGIELAPEYLLEMQQTTFTSIKSKIDKIWTRGGRKPIFPRIRAQKSSKSRHVHLVVSYIRYEETFYTQSHMLTSSV